MLDPGSGKKLLIFLLVTVASQHRLDAALIGPFEEPAIPCKDSQDCVGLGSDALRDASCRNGFCVCKSGGETKNCSSADIVRHANRSTGLAIFRGCKVEQDCPIENSFCNTTISQCDCHKDYVLSSAKKACLKKADSLDFPCVEDKQCLAFLPNTTCRNDQCRCRPGYRYAGDACHRTIDLGGSCGRDEECGHVLGAVCTDRDVCDCAAETVVDSGKTRCLPVARQISDSCVESVQCSTSFPNAVCRDRSCECRDRYHFEPEMNRCFIDKALGENCANTYECQQSGEEENASEKPVQCVGNVCVCADTFQRVDDRCVNGGFRAPDTPLLVLLGIAGCLVLLERA